MQAQPIELVITTGTGFSSVRMWVNGKNSSRTYSGNFTANDYTIPATTNAALSICGQFDTSNPTNIVNGGYFDILNFLWFDGSAGLYPSTTGKLLI